MSVGRQEAVNEDQFIGKGWSVLHDLAKEVVVAFLFLLFYVQSAGTVILGRRERSEWEYEPVWPGGKALGW